MSSRGTDFDVIVVGLGIAGLTATMFLARQGLRVLSIGLELGGQLAKVPLIENYPGLGPTSGAEIIRRIETVVRKYSNVSIEFDEVTRILPDGDIYRVATRSGHEYTTYAVIIASGKSPRKLGVPEEEKFLGKGLSYCVLCDAPLFRGKRVLLVSTLKPGLEMELGVLASYCSVLYWIPYRVPNNVISNIVREFRDKIHILRDCTVKHIIGEDRVRGVVLQCPDETEIRLDVDGIFVELGYEFKTDFVRDLVQVNDRGEIVIDHLCRTSREGIFAAGDVTAVPYKQAVIAAGQGAIAALSAAEYLSRKFGIKVRRVDWGGKPTGEFKIGIKL